MATNTVSTGTSTSSLTTSLNGGNVIVWTWLNDVGLWNAYEPNVSNALELSFQQGLPLVTIGHIDPALTHYQIDIRNMKQIRTLTGTERQINRTLLDNNCPLGQGVLWEFKGDQHWTAYDIDTLDEIEAAYLQNDSQLDLAPSGMPYTINFTDSTQVRQDTGTVRKIRRRQLNSLYTPENSNGVNAGSGQGTVLVSRPKRHTSRPQPYAKVPSASNTAKSNVVYRQVSNDDDTNQDTVTESLPSVKNISNHSFLNTVKSGSEVLSQYMTDVNQDLEKNVCCICCDQLSEPSSYGGTASHEVVQLTRCGHQFHKQCLLTMYESTHKGNSLQCPSCNTIYGEKTGNCPPGSMSWYIAKSMSLAGYKNYKTIVITYNIRPGVQGPEHPQPGHRFSAHGFPRQGFLPDCDKGRKILKLLMEAFKRRLTFTIATSHTTGETNTVTWNEIHHKTEAPGNIYGHGYPDPKYLDNVLLELAAHGVTESSYS